METYAERRRTCQAIHITGDTTDADIPGAINAGGVVLYPAEGGYVPLPSLGYLVKVSANVYRHESVMSFEHDWEPTA